MIETYLAQIDFWHWFALAVTLGILDILIGVNFVLVWCGLAAVVVGVVKWVVPSLDWQYQFMIFGMGVFCSLGFWRHYLKKHPVKTDQPHLNQRAKQYLNREFTLESSIINGRGKVKVDDTIWRVLGDDLPAGTRVKVIGVEGVILKIIKMEDV
jgi:membrane protein implicated in regulation of membrane protease activity